VYMRSSSFASPWATILHTIACCGRARRQQGQGIPKRYSVSVMRGVQGFQHTQCSSRGRNTGVGYKVFANAPKSRKTSEREPLWASHASVPGMQGYETLRGWRS
jgi:hypothetical protein